MAHSSQEKPKLPCADHSIHFKGKHKLGHLGHSLRPKQDTGGEGKERGTLGTQGRAVRTPKASVDKHCKTYKGQLGMKTSFSGLAQCKLHPEQPGVRIPPSRRCTLPGAMESKARRTEQLLYRAAAASVEKVPRLSVILREKPTEPVSAKDNPSWAQNPGAMLGLQERGGH